VVTDDCYIRTTLLFYLFKEKVKKEDISAKYFVKLGGGAHMVALNVTGYEVWRSSGGQWSLIDETAQATCIDNNVLPETTYQYYLIAINAAGSSSPSAIITVKTPPSIWIDLDIDSFNTSRFAAPSRTQAEDDIEDDPELFGKIIQPNFGDRDKDGILDCWDGFGFTGYYTQANPNSSEQFVPIVLQIIQDNSIDYANTTITFDYTMAEMSLLPDKTKAPSYNDGEIRIWTRDGGQVRMLWNLKDGGNLVETGVDFTLQELGFLDSNGTLITDTITLYVEGVSVSSQLAERINVRANYLLTNRVTVNVGDSINYTVLAPEVFDLAIDSDNDGVISCLPLEDQMEEDAPGKLIPISATSAADLRRQLVFKWFGDRIMTVDAAVKFIFPSQYKLYTARNGGVEIHSGQTYYPSDFPGLFLDGMTMLYVSATSASANTRDFIEVHAYPRGAESWDGSPIWVLFDQVAVSTTPFSNDLPEVGIYGDIHAVEGTNDTISFNLVRKGDLSREIKVRFKIDWAISNSQGITIDDFKSSGEQIRLEKLLVPGATNTYEITIPTGQSKSETIYLQAYEDDSQVSGEAFKETALLTVLPDPNPDPTGIKYNVIPASENVKDKNYRYIRPTVELAIFEQLTLFGDQNTIPQLADPSGSSGININDVRQGALGDCYFMTALLALADRFPAWIMGQITGSPFTLDYTVKMYNQDGTRYQDILFDKNGNLLSNGWDMAWLSNDYLEWVENGQTIQGYEIWPQIYEKAWVQMNGGTYQSISDGYTDVAWKALTGANATRTDCTGKTHAEILQIIDNAKAAGKIVCVGTKPGPQAMPSTDALAGLSTGSHAYYLTGTSINDYLLNNPWGKKISNENGQTIVTSQNVLMQNLKNKSGVLDLSQYINWVYILDPIY